MDHFYWKKWQLNTDSFECFINMLAQITVYIELWIKEAAQKYAEKSKKLVHQNNIAIQKWTGNHEELQFHDWCVNRRKHK